MQMHPRVSCVALALAALVAVMSACGGGGGGSSASCVGPYLDDQAPGGGYGGPTPTVAVGGSVRIYGHWYTSTCNDTGGNAPLRPLPAVHLSLTLPDGESVPLGEFTPKGADMGFSADVTVPPGTVAGVATIQDDTASPHSFGFDVGPPARSGDAG